VSSPFHRIIEKRIVFNSYICYPTIEENPSKVKTYLQQQNPQNKPSSSIKSQPTTHQHYKRVYKEKKGKNKTAQTIQQQTPPSKVY